MRSCASLLLAAALLVLAVPLPALGEEGPSAVEVARRVQARYGAARTYQASFRQTFVARTQGTRRVSHGRLAFARPGKLSFRYDKPHRTRVVSDGKLVKLYDPAQKRVYHLHPKASLYPLALAFMTGAATIEKRFDLRLLSGSRVDPGHLVLEARPKKPTPLVQRLVLLIDGKTASVERVMVIDALGNTNRFDLLKPRLHAKIPAREFRFNPPKGTRVVKP